MTKDEPELFEYNGAAVPEAAHQKESQNENITSQKLNAKSAFDAFSGKYISEPNFLDIGGVTSKSSKGYTTTYEITSTGSVAKETVLQKFNRLKVEVAELQKEISQTGNNNFSGENPDIVNNSALLQQVLSMQKELSVMQVSNLDGTSDPLSISSQALIENIEKFKTYAVSANTDNVTTASKTQGGNDQITYELFYKPEIAKLAQVSQLFVLEERIAKIENVLGADIGLTVAKSSTNLGLQQQNANIQGILNGMNSRLLTLKDDPNLQDNIKKMKDLLSEEQIKNTPPSTAKINELYTSLMQANASLATLPDIIERLKVLRIVHETAVESVNTIQGLDAQQSNIENMLKTQQAAITELEKNLSGNLETTQKNIQALAERIKAL